MPTIVVYTSVFKVNTFSGILIEFCVSVFNLGMYVSGFFAFLVHEVAAINVKVIMLRQCYVCIYCFYRMKEESQQGESRLPT